MNEHHLLGIDYGESKIGLAISEHGEIAHEYKTIIKPASRVIAIKEILTICEAEHIETVVIGIPQLLGQAAQRNHTYTEHLARIYKFGKQIKRLATDKGMPLDVYYENEQFTTILAKTFHAKDDDKKAAELILQGFIDKKRLRTQQSNPDGIST